MAAPAGSNVQRSYIYGKLKLSCEMADMSIAHSCIPSIWELHSACNDP
jgi:hypothetical protein